MAYYECTGENNTSQKRKIAIISCIYGGSYSMIGINESNFSNSFLFSGTTAAIKTWDIYTFAYRTVRTFTISTNQPGSYYVNGSIITVDPAGSNIELIAYQTPDSKGHQTLLCVYKL